MLIINILTLILSIANMILNIKLNNTQAVLGWIVAAVMCTQVIVKEILKRKKD